MRGGQRSAIQGIALMLLALLMPACTGSTRLSVVTNGVERWATVDRPRSQSGPSPLLIVLHGATLDGAEARSELHRHLARRQTEVTVAYPDSGAPFWNDGSFSSVIPQAFVSGDDLAFLDRLIATLVADGAVDPAAVHIAGISNGGMMALHYACSRAGRIASLTIFMATLPLDSDQRCQPSRPLNVLMVAGTADRITRWTGEVTLAGTITLQQRMSVPASFAFWQRANRCTGLAPARLLSRRADRSGPRVLVHAATSCANGADTLLYEVRDGGHRLPGDTAWPLWWALGQATLDLDAGALLLDFALRRRDRDAVIAPRAARQRPPRRSRQTLARISG